jgi:hypothetical protein
MGVVIEILALRALALQAHHESSDALAALERALALAEPEGFVRVFVDEGAPMKTLLSELLQARRKEDQGMEHLPSLSYVRRLLAALESPHTNTTRPSAPDGCTWRQDQPLPERLTSRESEVLVLIAEGASNQEIANRLFIEVSTVKSYVNRIARPPSPAELGAWPSLIPTFFLLLLIPGIGGAWEEPGWRGYAFPHLQAGSSALLASLILGIVWAFWHLPLMVTEVIPWSDIAYVVV